MYKFIIWFNDHEFSRRVDLEEDNPRKAFEIAFSRLRDKQKKEYYNHEVRILRNKSHSPNKE